jgi:methyltransferase-like protein/SAM-dependent methyltransferase
MTTKADAAERALAESYDITPYAGNPYYHTHPGILAAYGILYGLSPSAPGHSRVLEMGCGDGSNIIPMAYEFPASEFMGIDLSPVQIGIGHKSIDSLGLKNIQLETRSIMDMSAADGMFDYVILHGVYSWVPDGVRKKILEICRSNLSDQGIAYISYNALPGWRFNQFVRDMVLYRTRDIKDPKQRVGAALDLFKILLEGSADGKSVHDVQLRFFGKTLKGFPDVSGYLIHEYMETDNTPFYFHEFASDLTNNGLQYICDADQPDFELDSLPGDTAAKFEKISENAIDLEQYIDFFKNTCFRRSLVCHEGIDVSSEYSLERIQHLYAATDVVPILDTPDKPVNEAIAFRTPEGRSFSTKHNVAQVILRKLSEIKPCTIAVTSLIEAVARETASELEPDFSKQAEKIGHAIYALFFNGVMGLLGSGRQCILDAGDFPTASPVSRLLAPSRRVTNLCHRTIVMDNEMASFVLAHLDGTRDRDALCDLMTEAVHTGQIQLSNIKTKSVNETRISMRKQLESNLQHLPRCGVLIA